MVVIAYLVFMPLLCAAMITWSLPCTLRVDVVPEESISGLASVVGDLRDKETYSTVIS